MKSSLQHLPPTTYHLRPAPRHLPRVSIFSLLLACLFACTAHAAEYLVATNGNDAASGMGGWANALRTIGAAVAKATRDGDIVTVSNGVYNISNQLVIANGIVVRSFERGLRGASNTVVRRGSGSARIFNIRHAAAVVEGFTIRDGKGNGFAEGSGGGVYMIDGLIRECIITGNAVGQQHTHGVGIYMTGGTVENSIIRENQGGWNHSSGGGFYATGGRILFCRILNNAIGNNDGGGVCAGPAVLIHGCLIAGNSASGSGGGVYGGKIENCTIANNRAVSGEGGGTWNSAVSESIVYGNQAAKATTHDYSGGSFRRTCATPLPAGEGNLDGDPCFVSPTNNDFRLQPASSCVNRILVEAAGPQDARDLDGNPRVYQEVMDLGAIEYWPVVPVLRPAGVSRLTDKSASVVCNVMFLGLGQSTLFVCHGPTDGGTNRQAWAREVRFPGTAKVGLQDAAIAHSASNRIWYYRCVATNLHGISWAERTSGFMLKAVDVKTTGRESTEERPAAFVISRPANVTNGPLDVYFTLGGTGVNGTDYEPLESPVVIPAGAASVKLTVTPRFNTGDQQPKSVELTLAPGGYTLGVNRSARILTRAE